MKRPLVVQDPWISPTLSDEEIPGVPSDDDEVYRSTRYGECLALHHPTIVPQPSRPSRSSWERIDSPYGAKDISSIVSEADLFL